MSVDREYKIKITTETQGDPGAAARGLNEASNASEKAAKGEEGLFESRRHNREILREMADQTVPGLGQAISATALGPAGAVIGLTMLFGAMQEHIKKVREEIEAAGQAANLAFGGGVSLNDYVDALGKMAENAQKLAEELQKAQKADAELKQSEQEKVISELLKKLGATENVQLRTEIEGKQKQLANLPSFTEQDLGATQPNVDTIKIRKERADELAKQQQEFAKASADQGSEQDTQLREEVEKTRRQAMGLRALGAQEKDVHAALVLADILESQTAEARMERSRKVINELNQQVTFDKSREAAEQRDFDTVKDVIDKRRKLGGDIQELQDKLKTNIESGTKALTELAPQLDPRSLETLAGFNQPGGIQSFIQRFLQSQRNLQFPEIPPVLESPEAKAARENRVGADRETIALMNQVLQSSQQKDQAMFEVLKALIALHGNTTQELNRKIDEVYQRFNRPGQ